MPCAAAQNEFYGGGDEQALRGLLIPDITWTVPGTSPIAGVYRGADEVFSYFRCRRDRAGGTFRMHRRDVLVGDTNRRLISARSTRSGPVDRAPNLWTARSIGVRPALPGVCFELWSARSGSHDLVAAAATPAATHVV
jgi:hypothetical protein